jgi:tetratricopeptide (TPR) repeat protein
MVVKTVLERKAMKQPRELVFILVLLATLFLGCPATFVGAAETCEQWVAKVVSVQGDVQARRAGETEWVPVDFNDTYCPGDIIRVLELSRAAVALPNEATLRLDQNTTITFAGPEKEQTLLLKLLSGAAHFLSRIPRTLKVATPFVNGAVEGTEFLVRVEQEQTFLSVFEGQVAASNEAGSLLLASGQAAVALKGQAPVLHVVVRPRDAVQWALYYPPVLDYRPADFPGGEETEWQAVIRRSLEFYWRGDIARAFFSLEEVTEDVSDPRFFNYRAALLLTVGRVEEARDEIERALNLDPSDSHPFALQAVIAVVQNQKDRAFDLAQQSVKLNPQSPVARVALSYALQARFELEGALDSLREAVRLDPENGLAWARLAELWLSSGYLDKSLEAAQRAVALSPNLARTQTVLGFAYLTQTKIEKSKITFEKAIVLDQADPLPRLGLGLAKIRDGDLKPGRAEIEIAATLDPNNSLIRSYLGKAFFDEKRTKLDEPQFAIAKELDPQDPTPWFYDAIRKQTVNRPIEAMWEMQKSIELNNNRAVYRSRLLLDQDLAARSASLARIYKDIGFEQLALVEGWKSVNTDPSNYSSHRLLADLYSSRPRHEIARVSELLQSQLLQPLNITPIQPQLAESNLLILQGAGPSDPSFNEFNPLFLRNRLALQANGVVGNHDTLGDDLVHSAVWGRVSYSLGQFHYENNGFRQNNDLDEDIYNVFTQVSLSYKTSLQAEFRYKDVNQGDLKLAFDPEDFRENLQVNKNLSTYRLGFHHAFSPNSDVIVSFIAQDRDEKQDDFNPAVSVNIDEEEDSYSFEAQHLFRSERFNITTGIGHFDADFDRTTEIDFFPPPADSTDKIHRDIRHTNGYLYAHFLPLAKVNLTGGLSYDHFDDEATERDKVNPKLGLTWGMTPALTLRFAVFRVLTRTLVSDQTVEPTQVAGFNQFFDDKRGTESWLYGVALDHNFFPELYGGAEFFWRDLTVPYRTETAPGVFLDRQANWDEYLGRVYLYWAPHPWLASTMEYQYEKSDRGNEFAATPATPELDTHRVLWRGNFFHPSGFFIGAKATYAYQDGEFGDPALPTVKDDDQFWVLDGALGYRLPKRYGIFTMEVQNILDEDFKFQDTDPANPSIAPDRLILFRLTLSF